MNLLKNTITDYNLLITLIPQKKPFIMVDSLRFYNEKKVISGLKLSAENILSTKTYFSEAGLIENMAQTIALHTGYKYYLKEQPAPTGYIGAIKKVEIFKLPLISEELITTVEILHDIMNVTLVTAMVMCKNKTIASCEMKTALAQ